MKLKNLNIENSFEQLKELFEEETTKNWDDHLDLYINFINMKINCYNATINKQILKEIKKQNK
jgi:hypothetical protein